MEKETKIIKNSDGTVAENNRRLVVFKKCSRSEGYITNIVSMEMGVEQADIFSKSKKKAIVYARHLCMYAIARNNPRVSQADIAVLFGVTCSAVSKAVSVIEFEATHYTSVRIQVEKIIHTIQRQ